MELWPPVPILRSFDEAKALEFYRDYLGFGVDWTHRFEPELPLYMQVSRAGCVLHLSEHHGDAAPGARIRVRVDDLDGLLAELKARVYVAVRPGIVDTPWGDREISMRDPFYNTVTFYAPSS